MAELVRDTRDERSLGPDHDEARVELAGEPKQALAVLRTDGMAPADGGDAGISGGRVQLGEVGALREFPRQGVLAPARADEEDFHAASLLSRV